jgi:Mrp family chromosome partitioning ATPase
VARGIAAAAASAGERVLLIEADFRTPGLLGDQPERGGLADALTGRSVEPMNVPVEPGDVADVSDRNRWDGVGSRYLATAWAGTVLDERVTPVALPPGFDGGSYVDVLPSGHRPPNPVQFLKSAAMRAVVQEARSRYELVVIDTAPLEMVADSLPLVALSDAAIIVGRPGVTTRSAATALRDRLEMVAAPVIGTVVNGVAGGGYADDYHRVAPVASAEPSAEASAAVARRR